MQPPPKDDDEDDQAFLAQLRNPQPGGTFTAEQTLRSLLALVAPSERAQTLRELRELTRQPRG